MVPHALGKYGIDVDVTAPAQRVEFRGAKQLALAFGLPSGIPKLRMKRRVFRPQRLNEPLAGSGVRRVRDFGPALGEPFFLLQLHALPRRIREDAVEAAVQAGEWVLCRFFRQRHTEHVRESELPVEELILVGETFDFVAHPFGLVAWVAFELLEDVVRDGVIESASGRRALLPHKRGAPGVGQLPAGFVAAGTNEFGIDFFLRVNLRYGVVGQARELSEAYGEIAEMFPRFEDTSREHQLASCFLAIRLLEAATVKPVIAFNRLEGGVGNAMGHERGRRAEEGVAALDVVVEEGERLTGFERLQPERELAKFDGHRVDVHAV